MPATRATADRRRAGVGAVLLAAGAATLVGWGLWAWFTAGAPTADARTAAPLMHGSETLGAPTAANRAEPVVASAAAAAAAASVLPVAVAAPRPTQMSLDLCGVGPVSIRLPPPGAPDASFELLPRPLGQHARSEAWSRVLAALDASSADSSRAAALVLRASGLLYAEASPLAQTLPDTTPYVRQLAALAGGTRDAGVLQWALSVCQRSPRLAECQALSVRDLVALAPEDGRNWLLLAAADAGKRDEALRRAASAPGMGVIPSLTPAVEDAAPPDLPPYLLQELLVHALGVESALVDPAMFGAFHHCRTASKEQRDSCAALADVLHQRGTDLLTLGLARSIGGLHGWSPERTARAKADEALLTAQFPKFDEDQPYGCANVQRTRDYFRERATLGERATLKRRAAAAAAASAATR